MREKNNVTKFWKKRKGRIGIETEWSGKDNCFECNEKRRGN